jgi:hypothetical protein
MPPEAFKPPPWGSSSGTAELWSPRAVFAYSGGDLATLNGKSGFLLWGGGHHDSPDNSLYFTPFDRSGPRRLSGPFLIPPGGDYYPQDGLEHYTVVSRNQPGVTVAAAPKSRHTYATLVTVIVTGKTYFFAVGGGMASLSGFGSNVARMFDLSLTYEQAMARPDMGWTKKANAPAGTLTASAGLDTKTGLIVVRARTFYGAYDPVGDSWTRWGDAGGGSDYEASVAMDVEGRKMYVLGGHIAEVINLDTHVLTSLGTWDGTKVVGPAWVKGFVSHSGAETYFNGPGVAWHPGRKRLIVYPYAIPGVPSGGGQQQNILQIDPVAGTIETLMMGGVQVQTRPDYAFYGRFRLIPGTDTVVLAGKVDADVYIGQLPPASRPTGLLDAPSHILRTR